MRRRHHAHHHAELPESKDQQDSRYGSVTAEMGNANAWKAGLAEAEGKGRPVEMTGDARAEVDGTGTAEMMADTRAQIGTGPESEPRLYEMA